MNIICNIETPFPQKFGIPRQPLLVEEAWGKLVFPKNDFYSEAFRGLENFTHLWLIFSFHLIQSEDVKGLVSPPRFDGKLKLGVFASRSPHRPNPLGISVVKFDRIEVEKSQIILWVKGVDLVNGTPILDIKPYVPYCDSIKDAEAKLFENPPSFLPVRWDCPYGLVTVEIRILIEKIIALDPRPAHDKGENFSFGVSVAGFNARFRKDDDAFVITELTIV